MIPAIGAGPAAGIFPGDFLPLPLEFFAGLFLEALPVVPVCLSPCWPAVSARIFSRNFSRKKAPENFGPVWAVVFRRCCFLRHGERAAIGPACIRSGAVSRFPGPGWKIADFAIFAKNLPEILVKNNSPVPLKGGRGERFWGD